MDDSRTLGRHWGYPVRIATVVVVIVALAHAQVRTPAELEMPRSHNPFSPYTPDRVSQPVLTNSPRLDGLFAMASCTSL